MAHDLPPLKKLNNAPFIVNQKQSNPVKSFRVDVDDRLQNVEMTNSILKEF